MLGRDNEEAHKHGADRQADEEHREPGVRNGQRRALRGALAYAVWNILCKLATRSGQCYTPLLCSLRNVNARESVTSLGCFRAHSIVFRLSLRGRARELVERLREAAGERARGERPRAGVGERARGGMAIPLSSTTAEPGHRRSPV